MKIETLTVELNFTTEVLATLPGNTELLETYIASRAPEQTKSDEELATAEGREQEAEKMSTVFAKDEQGIFAWDYQIRGGFKGWLMTLIELGECGTLTKWSYKGAVDRYLHISERKCRYLRNGAFITAPDGFMSRPLRATTMQGDRVCIARSEKLDVPLSLRFQVNLLQPEKKTGKKGNAADAISMDLVKDCLNMGVYSGFSQWRGGGFGKFTWKEVE